MEENFLELIYINQMVIHTLLTLENGLKGLYDFKWYSIYKQMK
jgi:hypothetical protein